MPRQKESAPTMESLRASDQTITSSLTPWTASAQLAIVAAWVLFGVVGITAMVIP
ncbi:MAG: hypothetical protein RSB04_10735 [Gordonibacter sp.]|uniref:hypothetical protein n=1 Tax=Gordonibacter sp. TaxID=1968902 RepID=UPI002FC6380B